MQKIIHAEVNILDRIMWMLEEGSVTHIAMSDEAFAQFIEGIYAKIGNHRASLLTP